MSTTIDLTDEMLDLLREGAKTSYGRCCFPGEARRQRAAIDQLRRSGLIFMGENGDTPMITDAGRAAVGGTSLPDLRASELAAAGTGYRNAAAPVRRTEALALSRRKDDRVAFQICIHDESPTYMRISLDGDPKHAQNLYRTAFHGLPPIVVTQREGKFAVAHIRGREVIKFGFVQRNVPLLSKDVEWTVDEVRAWRTMRLEMLKLRHTLEQLRWKAKGHKPVYAKMRFGETA